jgi:hypothetical protein
MSYRVSRREDYLQADYEDDFCSYRETAYFRLESAHAGSLTDECAIAAQRINLLPTTAEMFYDNHLEPFCWGPTLKALLAGTRDKEDKSPLVLLRAHETTLVRHIYSYVSNQWARHVRLTIPAALVGRTNGADTMLRFDHGRDGQNFYRRELLRGVSATSYSGVDNGFVSFSRCGFVLEFPEPAGRNVNMMPFRLGDKSSLPDDLQSYHELIEKCPYMEDEIGKVGYLTVHECYVDVGEAQRREGLHIESPGVFSDDPNASAFTPGVEHRWGMGVFFGPDRYEGGIYMASSVSNTSEVWDALVDKTVRGIVDKHGGCEHLRSMIGPGTKLQAGDLIWMTDCTPHEALPQEESGYRQFFRVVTPYVSHWYADHSTPNPRVSLPDHVTVVRGGKFEI